MDRAIYTMMNAAISESERHSITANNLSNASTSGFRAQIPTAKSIPIQGPTLSTRTLSIATTPMHSSAPGPIYYSGNNLDVAIMNDGWLTVQLKNGTEGYTKNGNITINEEGKLKVKNYPLLSSEGSEIEIPPGASLTISNDGVISVLGAGDSPKSIVSIGKLKLVKAKPNEFYLNNNGIFMTYKNKKLTEDTSVKLISGAFEESNVQTIDAIIKIINNARNFEINMKIINDINENSRLSNQILSFNQA
ncbi:flagellar component of cell-proximal portion of basal-body rod [Wigglesworthia glossinidia endosymbiont of Glossina morsitans morsitans (Yale colony)]|uniref:Flagellar basal-body rod protein FlgF n=1 Tax=Wigglesworthia glossinidia endosymbiont of Glossina morsitans morsitans (Yale colony) TaxID=1142511 RepID=H6Q5K2_WIGGL|nr:flagellar basal body rod protein FlgF [Wigglesworthia glossinidia]AFA40906.1 flagellar component of cell-proximal portion of basal-body rod [Wigglesworthia glossinidia endosymbiont of Glossina morsitans morsitans (Yale colony)]